MAYIPGCHADVAHWITAAHALLLYISPSHQSISLIEAAAYTAESCFVNSGELLLWVASGNPAISGPINCFLAVCCLYSQIDIKDYKCDISLCSTFICARISQVYRAGLANNRVIDSHRITLS